jgi:hypothetical protein
MLSSRWLGRHGTFRAATDLDQDAHANRNGAELTRAILEVRRIVSRRIVIISRLFDTALQLSETDAGMKKLVYLIFVVFVCSAVIAFPLLVNIPPPPPFYVSPIPLSGLFRHFRFATCRRQGK